MRLLGLIKNQKGVSLIEILVTMVIFTGGILYALRVFPSGFSTVRQSEYETIANKLAESELERLKGRVENLPESILAIDPENIDNVLLDIDPMSLKVLENVPAGKERFYSDANRIRRIVGEATRIPAPMPSETDWNGGSMYILNFAPVSQDGEINIYSNPLRRQSMTPDVRWLVWMGNRDYAIDYQKGLMYVRGADFDREFLVSYSYWDQSGDRPRLIAVKKITISVPARKDTDPDPQEVKLLAPNPTSPSTNIFVGDIEGFAGIEEYTDTVRWKFDDITDLISDDGSVPWSDENPYEFVVKDFASGILAFNPLGYEYQEITSSGNKPLIAYIDYDVADWHVIRDERKVPSEPLSSGSDYINVKLSLKSIKKIGDTNYDNNKYTGVAPGLAHSIIAVDTENGRTYDEESLVDIINAPALSVNYRDGIIGFHKSLHDRTFVIMYQANGDWAVQVFKACSVYTQRYDIPDDLNAFGYDNYYMGSDQRLYFPRCYAGASVTVSYSYKANGSDAINYVQGESFKISDDVDSNTGLCYIDLKKRLLDSGKEDIEITQVSKVYGTSIGVRTIWRISGRGLASHWKWRKFDVQTYITRPSE